MCARKPSEKAKMLKRIGLSVQGTKSPIYSALAIDNHKTMNKTTSPHMCTSAEIFAPRRLLQEQRVECYAQGSKCNCIQCVRQSGVRDIDLPRFTGSVVRPFVGAADAPALAAAGQFSMFESQRERLRVFRWINESDGQRGAVGR